MERIDNIIKNKNFLEYLRKNEKCEASRRYCKHNFEHAMDTARIAYIINLERSLNLDKVIIYAAALLHDIGKWRQYEEGISHEAASCVLAKDILSECSFNEKEIMQILDAISGHRKKEEDPSELNGLIALADKLSRNCFYCTSIDKCNWVEEKKNKSIYF